jgi:chaperonin GroEL (HSP60 family)
MAAFVWEPSLVKINAIQAATEASCLILSVDETISKWQRTYIYITEHVLTR